MVESLVRACGEMLAADILAAGVRTEGRDAVGVLAAYTAARIEDANAPIDRGELERLALAAERLGGDVGEELARDLFGLAEGEMVAGTSAEIRAKYVL